MDKDHLKKFDRTGVKHTDESKEKMRQAKLGKKRGEYKKKHQDNNNNNGETK
ncbi:hypothetical protein [Paraburkholderia graminis]